jgi:DHA1 family multidrug resistance protein-like MFS transporter
VQLSWRGVNALFLVTNAISFAAEGHLVAFAPLQLRALGLSDADVAVWSGLLFAVTMATAMPLGPFWGVLAERYSRRAIILRSQVMLAVAMLVAAWAPDLLRLVVARAVMGLSFGIGGVIVATQVLLTPSNQVGRAIAVVQAAQPIAGSLGPLLGAFAIPLIGLSGLLLVDAGLLLVATVAMALLLPEPAGGHKPVSLFGRVVEVTRLAWAAPPIRTSFLNQTFARGASAVVDSYLPVRITQVAADPAQAIGWILGIYGAVTTCATWLLSRIADRVDVLRLYTLAMILGMGLTLALMLAPWLWLIAAVAVLRAIPTACSRSVIWIYLARVVPSQHRTGVFNLLPTAGNLGGLLFPLVASALAGLGLGAALAVAVLGHGVGAATGARLRRLRQGRCGPRESGPEPRERR